MQLRVRTCWHVCNMLLKIVFCAKVHFWRAWLVANKLPSLFAGIEQLLHSLEKLGPQLKDRQGDLQFLHDMLNSNEFQSILTVRNTHTHTIQTHTLIPQYVLMTYYPVAIGPSRGIQSYCRF